VRHDRGYVEECAQGWTSQTYNGGGGEGVEKVVGGDGGPHAVAGEVGQCYRRWTRTFTMCGGEVEEVNVWEVIGRVVSVLCRALADERCKQWAKRLS